MSKKEKKEEAIPFDPFVFKGGEQEEDVRVIQDLTRKDFRKLDAQNPNRVYCWLNPEQGDYFEIRSRGWQVDQDPEVQHFAKDPKSGTVQYCEMVLHSMAKERFQALKYNDKKEIHEFMARSRSGKSGDVMCQNPLVPIQEPGPMSRVLNRRRESGDMTPISAMSSRGTNTG